MHQGIVGLGCPGCSCRHILHGGGGRIHRILQGILVDLEFIQCVLVLLCPNLQVLETLVHVPLGILKSLLECLDIVSEIGYVFDRLLCLCSYLEDGDCFFSHYSCPS